MVGATFPRTRAVIGVMASGLIMGSVGDPEPGASHPDSAWTLGGEPIPNLFDGNPCVDWSEANPAVSLVPGYLAAMRHAASVERATIQVEHINGSVLLISVWMTASRRGLPWPKSRANDWQITIIPGRSCI